MPERTLRENRSDWRRGNKTWVGKTGTDAMRRQDLRKFKLIVNLRP